MANNLTGDFEAVVQIAVRQLNGVLATLHQNKIDPARSPSFQHSVSLRVGRAPLSLEFESARFKKWLDYTMTVSQASAFAGGVQAMRTLSLKTPPGLATRFEHAWNNLTDAILEPAPANQVRGLAQVQVSTPTISLHPGAVSHLDVSCFARARYIPDPGSKALPEPVHGEVLITYGVHPATLSDGRTVLRVQVPAGDQSIQFFPEPGTNLTMAERAEIASEVRHAVRNHFKATDVELGDDFAFTEFVGLGAGFGQAIALPIQLSDNSAPAGGIGSITNHFLGASELAIGVSKDYIGGTLNTLVASLRAEIKSTLADYTISVSSFNVVWKAGGIDLSGKVDLVTDSMLPNGWITFNQTLAAALDPATQQIALEPVGDPSIDESWWIPHSTAVDRFKSARDAALASAGTAFNVNATKARTKLAGGLQKFDTSASVRYTSIEVTADGLILRGAIGTSGRMAPVVSFRELRDPMDPTRTLLDAFQSWVPGGRVTRYRWSWVEMTHPIPWANKPKEVVVDHQFVCEKSSGMTIAHRVCLQLVGTRLTADGVPENVVAGEGCRVSSHEPILVAPPWWMKVYVPIWVPDPPDTARVEDMIAAHVNVSGNGRAPGVDVANVLVHFAGPRVERPLAFLSQTLAERRRADASLLAIVVLPKGSLRGDRRELEQSLGETGERLGAALHLTEDYGGGWSHAFDAREGPSTFALNARGELVWRHHGELDAEQLARALDEVLVTAPPFESRPLRLSLDVGQIVPDMTFTDEHGNSTPMRRLRGRPVLLTFWQSWSAPCVRELFRLEQMQHRDAGVRVFAVNGGEDADVLAAVRRDHGLTLPFVQDPGGQIAALFDIRCWPTTVSINADGAVDRVHFGLAHEPHDAGRAE